MQLDGVGTMVKHDGLGVALLKKMEQTKHYQWKSYKRGSTYFE